MAIKTHFVSERPFQWSLLWRWTLISLIGSIVGTTLYHQLPDALVNPQADENIWLEQPWRLAVINAVYYTPIILAQWLLLWRYVRQAWRWPTIILGSVVVVYPATIWMFEKLGRMFVGGGLGGAAYIAWELSWAVWFLGVEGSTTYLVTQWLAMLCWTHNKAMWGLSLVTTSFGWLVLFSLLVQSRNWISSGSTSYYRLFDDLYIVVTASLYQLTIGAVLAIILQPDTPHKAMPRLDV
jgi:hypothetical protein